MLPPEAGTTCWTSLAETIAGGRPRWGRNSCHDTVRRKLDQNIEPAMSHPPPCWCSAVHRTVSSCGTQRTRQFAFRLQSSRPAFRKHCKTTHCNFSSWDPTVLTCCATFVCSAFLLCCSLHVVACVLGRVSSFLAVAGVLASVFRSSLSVAGFVSWWLPARVCVSLSAVCTVHLGSVGEWLLPPASRCAHTVRGFLSCTSIHQLSRSTRPEFRYGRVWGPVPLPLAQPYSPLRRCSFALGFSWRWSPPSSLPLVRMRLLVPRFRCFSFSFSRLGSRLGSLFWLRSSRNTHAACFRSASSSPVGSCLWCACQPLYDWHHSVDHSARPFRGPCRACTSRSRLVLRQLQPPLVPLNTSCRFVLVCSIRFSVYSSSVRLLVIATPV